MKFTKNDLLQMDADFVKNLTNAQVRQLSLDLLDQTKELMDRLNQNSSNSSKPPSQNPPWSMGNAEDDSTIGGTDKTDLDNQENNTNSDVPVAPDDNQTQENSNSTRKRNPGKQPGAPGYGRTIEIPITNTQNHVPCECVVCGEKFTDDSQHVAINGHHVLDIETTDQLGISLTHIKHIYFETTCSCGHTSQALPGSADKEEGWSVKITEWHLCGPMLVSLIVCLSKRYRLSRNKIQEFLKDWLNIHLSKGVINKSILEAGRATAPLEEQLIEEIKASGLIYIDETGWKEFSSKLWLWVFATSTVCLFMIGPRTKAMAKKILDTFTGTLMSDGYNAYRHFKNRLRCWAHLERKLRGLAESTNKTAQTFGRDGLEVFEKLKVAVKAARDGPDTDISEKYADVLATFKVVCVEHSQCTHDKASALAKEFLNDWEAIWCVLSNVAFPLTNNEAERLLRHWVIDRKICFGTKTKEGSNAFALLASVIETCRLRNVSPWPYLAEVIAARRKNQPAPPLPKVEEF